MSISEAQIKDAPIQAKSDNSSNNIQSDFDFLKGNWIVYNSESALAAYNKYTVFANGNGVLEQYESKEGAISVGLFYIDPVSGAWMHTWVSNENKSINSIGTRREASDKLLNKHLYYFYGENVVNGKKVKDRFVFNQISRDTLQKAYEVSSDAGITWDVEYKLNFKRIN